MTFKGFPILFNKKLHIATVSGALPKAHANMRKMLISCNNVRNAEFLHNHHGSEIGERYLRLILVFQPQPFRLLESFRSDPLDLQISFFDGFIYLGQRFLF